MAMLKGGLIIEISHKNLETLCKLNGWYNSSKKS